MREYLITTGGATVAGSSILVFIRASAAPNVNIELLRHWVSFGGTATSAQQRVALGLSSGPPTTTAFTPVKKKEQDSVSVITGSTTPAAGACGINASVETTKTATHEDAFNVLNGFLLIHTPAETIIQPTGATSGHVMYFPTTPSVLTTWSFGEIFREV